MARFSVRTHAFLPARPRRSTRAHRHLLATRLADPERQDSDRLRRERVLYLPPDAPAWAREPRALWSAARAAERRRTAPVALPITLELPAASVVGEPQGLVADFVREHFTEHGRVVDVTFHLSEREARAHLVVSMRRVDAGGIAERVHPAPDAQQLLAWEHAWNRLCARALHPALVASLSEPPARRDDG